MSDQHDEASESPQESRELSDEELDDVAGGNASAADLPNLPS
jgi:hypothetical protein